MGLTEEQVRKIAGEVTEAFFGAHFRDYLRLAVNGGEGQFADAQGNALPLVRDEALLSRFDTLADVVAGHVGNHGRQDGAERIGDLTVSVDGKRGRIPVFKE